jgi:hypothetical protein
VGLAQIMCRAAISQLVCIAAFLGDDHTGAKRFEWNKFGKAVLFWGAHQGNHALAREIQKPVLID